MDTAARLFNAGTNELLIHLQERALKWGVSVESVVSRAGAVIAFSVRAHQPVVLKIVAHSADERGSGPVLQAFGGRGMVRALEHADGAVLLERLLPGRALIDEAVSDDEASEIMAVFSLVLYPRWVRFFFLEGVAIDDPRRRLEGTGTQVRSIRVDAGAAVLDDPYIRRLMAAALKIAERGLEEGQRSGGAEVEDQQWTVIRKTL